MDKLEVVCAQWSVWPMDKLEMVCAQYYFQ